MKSKVFNIRLAEEHANDELNMNRFLEAVDIRRIFTSFTGMSWSVLIFYEKKSGKMAVSVSPDEIVLSSEEQKLYDALRNWRSEQAKTDGLQSYMIAHNLALKQMVKMPVKTKEDLLLIKGFGAKRAEKYGDNILKVIESWPKDKASIP